MIFFHFFIFINLVMVTDRGVKVGQDDQKLVRMTNLMITPPISRASRQPWPYSRNRVVSCPIKGMGSYPPKFRNALLYQAFLTLGKDCGYSLDWARDPPNLGNEREITYNPYYFN